jgi:phosphopantothenoylcysteine decarboxylase/phosphopantothenate--cysteine ligase
LQQKQLDMIAANLVGIPEQGFAANQNALTVLWSDGQVDIALADKYIVAKQLLDIIATRYNTRSH